MRIRRAGIVAAATALVVAGAGTALAVSALRRDSFIRGAGALRATWLRDEDAGVPAARLTAVEAELAAAEPRAGWWSPRWWGVDGTGLTLELRSRTDAIWSDAVARAQEQAGAVVAEWRSFAATHPPGLDPGSGTVVAGWPRELADAGSPAAIHALVVGWQGYLLGERRAVAAARLQQDLVAAGGAQGVLAEADRLIAVAAGDQLDSGVQQRLESALRARLAAGADPAGSAADLLPSLSELQAVEDGNRQDVAAMRPLLMVVDQAGAESTPTSPDLEARYRAIAAALAAARTADDVGTVSRAIGDLQTRVAGELAANRCGHPGGPGRVITVSLMLQEMVFYQDGCAVQATPITTGRPALRTPAGSFRVFSKQSPFTFVSPWPAGSPYWYPTSGVSWVMEFATGGYFIHDAPWEAGDAFGPGSENDMTAASHGCIHVPAAIMRWAYSWTPTGAAVTVAG